MAMGSGWWGSRSLASMSFRFMTRPKWVAWTLVVVLAVVVMVLLARWQWQRHLGRADANELIEARIEAPVVPIGELVTVGDGSELADAHTFRRVTATGTYRPEDQVLVANRSLDGVAGWWVVTPLALDDGAAVAVNRGFVPRSVTPEGPWDDFAPPEGEVTVTGLLQASQGRTAGPMDDPRTLPRLNVEVLDERSGADLVAVWLQLETQEPPQTGALPRTLPTPELDSGPHLSYAGQWLIFATLTVVVYAALVVRTARRGDGVARIDDAVDDEPGPPSPHGAHRAVADGVPVDRAAAGAPGGDRG